MTASTRPKKLPMPTPPPEPVNFDIVTVQEGEHAGIYPNPAVRFSARQQRTLVEMLVGRYAVGLERGDVPRDLAYLTVRETTPEKWEFVIGLVVCGLATRYEL